MNAIYVWGVAATRHASVLLRMEDHDRIRSRPEFETAIVEDLDWLGFLSGVDAAGSARLSYVRQSERGAVYEDALATLRKRYRVYACDCSRKDIGGEWYPGTCRNRGLADTAGRGLRVEIERGVEHFVDQYLGPQQQWPAEQCGDLLLRDRDGHWTYQFAVTVDDYQQDVTLVIRGADLLSSTGRQIRLARMLGRATPPTFLHHPLVMHPSGEKLSKSSGDTGVHQLRAAGVSAAEVIGRAALAAGLIDRVRPITASAVGELFVDR